MDLKNLPWYGQIGVFLLISAVLFGLFYFLHYEGVQTQIDQKIKQIKTIQIAINQAKIKLKELEQIKAEIEMNKKRLKQLDQILPKEKNISEILNRIQSLISNTQQEFKKMSKGTKKSKKLFVEFSYTINSVGNYHNLGTFFDQLSNLKKIFNVTSMTISPKKGKIFNPQFTISTNFRLSTYIQKKAVVKKKKGRRRRK